jgi:hypothetical protein
MGFVCSAAHIDMRQFEFFDNYLIQKLNELEMGPKKALALIDGLCSQEGDEEDNVSAALNILTWEQYRNGLVRDYDITCGRHLRAFVSSISVDPGMRTA